MVTETSYNQFEQRFRWTPTEVRPIEGLRFHDEKTVQETVRKESTVLYTYPFL